MEQQAIQRLLELYREALLAEDIDRLTQATRRFCAAVLQSVQEGCPMRTNAELYEQDFFEWTHTTAALIRAGKWHDIDPERLAEELESLG